MHLNFENITEFEKLYNASQTSCELNATKCSCGNYFEMQLESLEVTIGSYYIVIPECPMMICEHCGEKHICPNIPQQIYETYFHMQKQEKDACKLTMKSNIRYKYAEVADFKYDSRDMSIPGIGVDLDPTNPEGFSCPVYFDRKVLNNFYTDDDYELDFFSESYGAIAKKGTDDYIYEWKIVFGINKNNKAILFLGDLAQIDENDRAIYWLKSYNVDSDHCIVDTELYRGQFQCLFSEPIIEKRILALRNAFFKKIKEKYNIDLFHLESEVEDKGKAIQKPINYAENEIKANIIILDGVLNEGIDCSNLRSLCINLICTPPKNINDLKTRKLLQLLLSTKVSEDEAKELISPLFYLNDLRVCFAHLLPQAEIETYKTRIVEAFQLANFEEYRKLYDTLIEKLYKLYRFLTVNEF